MIFCLSYLLYVDRTIHRALNSVYNFYWIGLVNETSEGGWHWVNGNYASENDVTLWYPGQPNDLKGSENCGWIWFGSDDGGYLVHDYPCSDTSQSICEKLV